MLGVKMILLKFLINLFLPRKKEAEAEKIKPNLRNLKRMESQEEAI